MRAKRATYALTGLFLLALCLLLVDPSESKLLQQQQLENHEPQQQHLADGDDEEDEDDDEDEFDDESNSSYPSKPEIDDDGRVYKNPRNSPSAQCPRDELQAEILGQKCLRKCSTDEDCKSKKKKCRCDGICGMSCIKPERECPELMDIERGLMSVGGRYFGDRVNYSCDPGYHLVGLGERACRADGRWTGVTPSCKADPKSYCSPPSKLPNARHNALPDQMSFDLDSVVQYYCEHGYETKGSPKAKCLAPAGEANWYGPDIICEPKNCEPPSDIPNGWHAGECYRYNCHVAYHCADSYELVGKSEKICVADGSWIPAELPKCVEVTSVQCTNPEHPVNGKAIFTSVSYNAVVSYECKTGYTIVGMSTRRCGADGKWTGHAPICKEIDCGSPGVLYNGWIDNIENGTRMGASLIFRCNERMKLEGHSSSLCQLDGKWSYPVPQCLAPCVLPDIPRGHVYVQASANSSEHHYINNVTVAEHGKQLAVECSADYEFVASPESPVVCNNGTWSVMPACSPARCKLMPRAPRNGMVIAPKTEHGMRAVFKCKDGFEMVGGGPYNTSFSVECQYGNWTGDPPHCVEVYCPFPGYVQNGKVLLVGNMGVYDYRPYVKRIVNNKQIMYDCDKGYYLSEGPPGATCIGGSWSPKELPKCTLGQHPRIRWNRRRRRRRRRSAPTDDPSLSTSPFVVLAYRRFIDFFRRIGKKLLELEMERSHETLVRVDKEAAKQELEEEERRRKARNHRPSNRTVAHVVLGIVNTTGENGHGATRRERSRDERMMDFLRVVYRKLQRIDSRHNATNSDTNVTMHELLNVMSKNLFHVDLAEPKKNTSTSSSSSSSSSNSVAKGHENYEARVQREFNKLKREFERIMKFYNKSLRWSEKHLRKDLRKKKRKRKKKKTMTTTTATGHDSYNDDVDVATSTLTTSTDKSPNYYKGFYEFVNDYVTQKLTVLEAQNATEELIRKMKIDKPSARNGTMFTIGEIYAFFKHIIEAKMNDKSNNDSSSKPSESPTPPSPTTTTAAIPRSSPTTGDDDSTKTPSYHQQHLSENEIPSLESEDNQPKQRNKRIRNTSTRSPPTSVTDSAVGRKLLSVNHLLLGDDEQVQPRRPKRFLRSLSFEQLDNQTFLKNSYVDALEDKYRANLKRSIEQSVQNNQRIAPEAAIQVLPRQRRLRQ
ncbi:uncharacterized protein LOC106641587 isoform X2 [Copidosoma floridanum]|uniref:uncharacterized protein LOC106641587 isoform X2 n=1 Tax=Copidosoma floridanum TaxID=29053 RepID=UPI000C6F93F6|nr:uncharacterized protein LOC106641587 isoform X2 [Copidosoma floridanum]